MLKPFPPPLIAKDANNRQGPWTPQHMSKPQFGVLYLPRAGLAPKLVDHLINNPQSGGSDGMAEGFQSPVGIDRQLPVKAGIPSSMKRQPSPRLQSPRSS